MTKRRQRAVLYLRVSTSRQASEGHSLDGQRTALDDYANRHNLDVVEIVVDGGESGKALDRPGIRRVLALAEGKGVDVLLATKSDRICRSLRDLLNLSAELASRKVAIVTADGGFDTSTPTAKAMTQVRGVFDELERELIGQRTREGLAAAKEKGVYLGRAPVGWDVVDRQTGTMIPNDQIELVVRVHQMTSDGMTLQRIADVLNAEGVPTPGSGQALHGKAKELSGKAPRWHRPTVARALKSPLPAVQV